MDNKQSEIYDLGTKYAGPVLTEYVRWIINESLRLGIQRIYFLARDEYTLKK